MSQLAMGGEMPLGQAVSGFEKPLRAMGPFDPVETASVFGALLTLPELQSNCIRLEGLVHLALAHCRGTKKPTASVVARWFAEFGNSWLGRMEDPAEDIFLSNITTVRGNFRVIDGVWEAAGFYTQRMVNVVEGMPKGGGYDKLREQIYALLGLSDFVCERAGLARNMLGSERAATDLDNRFAGQIHALKHRVIFSKEDIEARGISYDALAAFVFNPTDAARLLTEGMGHSTLERYPLIGNNGTIHFVLPTAVTAAIRRLVVETMIAGDMGEALVAGIGREYTALFAKTPLLGGPFHLPVRFTRRGERLVAAIMVTIDTGRYLSFVFVVDPLDDFETTGIAGLQPSFAGVGHDVDLAVDHFCTEARQDPAFRDGITVVVGCGIGRGAMQLLEEETRPDWRVEHVGAAGLVTLSWLHRFKPLSLWRLLDAIDSVEAAGVELANVNGLVNLVAWARKLDGHIVPHETLPDSFGEPDQARLLMVEQNALRTLRHEVATLWDTHAEQDVDGLWRPVRKDADSLFKEDRARPIYATEEPVGRWPEVVFPAASRSWWGASEVGDSLSGQVGYQRMKLIMVWLPRLAPVLETAIKGLPEGPLCWRVRFNGAISELADTVTPATFDDALQDIRFECDRDNRTVTVITGRRYEDAIFHPENIAERALLSRTVEGFANLASHALGDAERDALVNRAMPDTAARETHAFRARHFRDHVRDSLPDDPLTIDREDDAAFRFGLGWQVRARSEGQEIHGKEACTAYLNAIVRYVEDQLCAELRRYDRRATIEMALRNHESASVERNLWERTSAAVLALRTDKDAARDTIARHEFRLAGAFQASRLLIELAVCECPSEGGLNPGALDFSRLMARMAFIQHAGGWSDAIRWGVMEPRVTIAPLGDIFVNYDFIDNVLLPFGRASSDVRVDEAVRGYAKNLEREQPAPVSSKSLLNEMFRAAWEEQFDVSFDETRYFVDAVEHLGVVRKAAVFSTTRSELIGLSFDGKPIRSAATLLDSLSLKPRASWRDVPEGFEERDRHPWRFRRRLSALRRPFVQVDDSADPTVLVAPGLVRDAFGYMLRNYHRGDFPVWQLRPLMRAWTGKAAHEQGGAFTKKVADRLNALGWRTDTEVKITKLLRKGFDRDYGDVDVLAWNPDTGRVLIIECKDVQYRKSFGEIAEQLSDFRGEVSSDGKRDLLRKHLDRVTVISEHLPVLAAYVGLEKVAVAESHLVFKNPVPMQFAWKSLEEKVQLHVFAALDQI